MTAALSVSELNNLSSFACELADVAGKVILPYFRNGVSIDNKMSSGGFDPVTEADRRA